VSIRVLLLGGTSEASKLAEELSRERRVELTVSLAGRTSRPMVAPHARLRSGGFGGVDGLSQYLREEVIDVVVDATHPFAAMMPFHAAEACEQAGVPLLKLYRPAWTPVPGDRWIRVSDLAEAAASLVSHAARRVFLTTGRQELEPFRSVRDVTFVVRSVEPPDLRGFEAASPLLMCGPFDLAGERSILTEHRIDTLVTKNSGGAAAEPKLHAARDLDVRVVMVERPPIPCVPTVPSVAEALSWLKERAGTSVE
jgi:precorrin-6A/cobalt-precorrin-6A reductase